MNEEQIREEAEQELDRLRATINPMDDPAQRQFVRELLLQTHVDQKAEAKRRVCLQAAVDNMHTALFVGDPVTKTPSMVEWLRNSRRTTTLLWSGIAGLCVFVPFLPDIIFFLKRL